MMKIKIPFSYSIFENTKFSFEQIHIQKESPTKFVSSTDLKLHNRYCHSAHSIFPASTFRQVQFLFSEAKVSVRPSLFVYSSLLLHYYTHTQGGRNLGAQGGDWPLRFQPETKQKSSPSKDLVLLLAPLYFQPSYGPVTYILL